MRHRVGATGLALVACLLVVLAVGAPATSSTDATAHGAGVIGWWRSTGALDAPAPVRVGQRLTAVDDAGSLVALDPVTGAPSWHHALPGSVAALSADPAGGVAAADVSGSVAWVTDGGSETWRTDLGVAMTGISIGDGALLAVGGSTVVALDPTSGAERWRTDLGGTVTGPPVLLGDRVLVGSGDRIVAMGASTGDTEWATDLGSPVSPGMWLLGGQLAAADWDGDLVGIDPAGGAITWRTSLPAGVVIDPAADQQTIAIVDEAGTLTALDPASRDPRWAHPATAGWTAFGRPTLADGAVWVVDDIGTLHVLEASDGSERWAYGVGLSDARPIVADGVVHIQTLDGPLVTLGSATDPRRPTRPTDVPVAAIAPEAASMAGGGPDATGWRPGPGPVVEPTELWRTEVGADISGGLVSDGDLVVGGGLESVLYGLDAVTGHRRWRFGTADWITQPPAITAGVVVVGDESAHVYGVDRTSGTQRWATELDAAPGAAIVTDGTRAYVLTRARTLVAIDVAGGSVIWTMADASAPAVADGRAWVITATGVDAVDAATGAILWTQPGSFPAPFRPTVSGGRLYVPNGTSILVLDALTGQPEPFELFGGSTGMTVGDAVAVLTDRATVSGLDLATGFVRWTSAPVSSEFVPVTPVLAGTDAYLATGDRSGLLVAVDAQDGTERWRFDAGQQLPLTTPAVVGHRIFVSVGPTVLALGDPSVAVVPTATPGAAGSAAPSGGAVVRTPTPPSGPRTTGMAGGDAGRTGMEPGPAPAGSVGERWRTTVAGTIVGGVAMTADVAVVATDEGSVLALDPATGQERWRASLDGDTAATPAIDGTTVYVTDGGLVALDAGTGAQRWRMDGVGATDPLVVGTMLVASGPDGVVAVDVGGARGLEAWRFHPDTLSDGFSDLTRPAVADGRIYVVLPAIRGGSGTLWALDAVTGDVAWERDDLEAVTPPAAAGGLVVVGTLDGLARLDAASGTTLLTIDTGSRPVSPPSTDGEGWYVGTDDGAVVASDPDGTVRWTFPTDDEVAAQPSIAGDTVVIASYDGFVYGVDRATGEERWRFETGREMDGAPSISSGSVIVPAGPELIAIDGGH